MMASFDFGHLENTAVALLVELSVYETLSSCYRGLGLLGIW